jgi:hypothetical protein
MTHKSPFDKPDGLVARLTAMSAAASRAAMPCSEVTVICLPQRW